MALATKVRFLRKAREPHTHSLHKTLISIISSLLGGAGVYVLVSGTLHPQSSEGENLTGLRYW